MTEVLPRTGFRARMALVACIVGMMSSPPAILLGSFPLFLGPVSKELGWGRTAFPLILMAVLLSAALLFPFVGRWVDRLGARLAALVGTLLWGIGLLLMARLGPSIGMRIIIVAFLGIGGALAGQIVYARVISSWFDRHRGALLGLVLGTAPAVSQVISALVASAAISTLGWRGGYLIFGGFVICVTLTLNLLFLREPEQKKVRVRAPDTSDLDGNPRDMRTGEAVKTARFWLITLVLGLVTGVYNGVFQHSVAILGDRGVSPIVGTAFVSTAALAAMVTPILVGYLLDRVKTPRSAMFPFMLSAVIGITIIAAVGDSILVLLAAVFMGTAVAAGTGVQPLVLARYFGSGAQSEIFGLSLIGVIVGAAIGPVAMGLLYDRSGGYALGLVVFGLVAALTAVLSIFLPRYRYRIAN